MAPRGMWLVKSEPTVYAYAHLEADGRTAWTGVRNYAARLHLRAMRPGDPCLYYHSNVGKEIVGVALVVGPPGPDPTAPGEDWTSVDLAPLAPLARPLPLRELKARPELAGLPLLTHSRLSVMPIAPADFARILELSGTRLPHGRSGQRR